MHSDDKEQALIEVLLERLDKQRLPRLLDIKKNLKQNNKLSDYDIEFLEEVLHDTKNNEHLIEQADDELKTIFMKVVNLYHEITNKALENEKKG